MARALWTGTLRFGLVTVPIEIHTAVRDTGPHFRLLRRSDKSPVRYQRVAESDGEVVAWEDIVKGYEYEKGRFITLTPEDFEKAAVKKDRSIEILDFVEGASIDDRFFDKPYYLLPGKGGQAAYALLREAIRESKRVGVAKIVLRSKQRLAAIEAIGDALVLSTMRFRDELARLEEFDFPKGEVRSKDLSLAERLIDEFASEWDPEKYTDDYRRNIMEIVEARRKRVRPDLKPEKAERSAEVVDLMERLRKSLGTRRASASASTRRRTAGKRKTGSPRSRKRKAA
ncbi:MAG TPA: Ku protein [Vicinamibacterales bacterium]|nr:Ku protein [Vicinamibacterales bacterium]